MANLEDNDSAKLTVDVTQDVADNFTSENYNSAIDKIDKKKDEIEKTITNNKSNIESAAKEFGVDKYVIAAIIYHEQRICLEEKTL